MLTSITAAMKITGVFTVVMISEIALAAPPQLTYKTLTGLLPTDQYSRDHMFTFTSDTSVVSKGCTVEERNGDKNTATNGVWEGEVTVDSWPFTVNICTRLPDMIKVLFTLEQSPINQCYDETTEVTINGGMPYPCRNFIFCNGTKLGTLMVQVSCDPNACPENNFKVFVDASFPNSTIKLISNVVTTNPIIGKPVTIEAKLQSTSGANIKLPKISSAVMRIIRGDGSAITKVMNVLLSNTAIGKFIPTFSDHQKSQLVDSLDQVIEMSLKFVTAFGDEPIEQFRTVTHIIYSVLESILQRSKPSISKTYSHPVTNSEMVKFTVPLCILKTHARNNYRYFTEVWGTDADGTEKAICWITGLTDVQFDNSTEDDKYYNGHFDVEMDTNWMIITKTLFPLHFRNFSIEETSGFVELVKNNRMEIDHDPWLSQWTANKRPEEVKITREMTEGYNPALYNSKQIINSKLLLIHGYCSSDDAFPTDTFTDYAVFRDYDQSRDTDEFAQLIDQYARSQDINAYSIVAHSQGGMAALHLFTYYHSGLDLTTSGDRKIQTVGTPWQGTPVMAKIADLTKCFDISCGYNEDLTPQGASRWLNKIPIDKQKEVYYYTTEGGEKPCQFVTDFILDDPNDGVVEKKRAQLPGGNWVSHTQRECHGEKRMMEYPSQCLNATRNGEMNKHAAR